MNPNSELYKYNSSFYASKRESSHYFAQEFLESELDDDHVSWLHISDISDEAAIEKLCTKLSIDKLNIESISQTLRRSKVEEYNGYIFFSVIFAETSEENDDNITQDQLTFFLGKNYLLSFQKGTKGYFKDVRHRIVNARGKIRLKKSDFLLYRCLEAVIDNYHQIIDEVITSSNEIETRLHIEENKDILHSIEEQKKKLIQLRSIARPLRVITEQLNSSESTFIEDSNQNYFKNLNFNSDHVIEEIESQIQILDGMTNFYYAAQGERMNEIMKVLTVVSSVFIPLTFIVGVYGMNFEYTPEFKWKNGYLYVWILLLLVGGSFIGFFMYRGWLKWADYFKRNNKR